MLLDWIPIIEINCICLNFNISISLAGRDPSRCWTVYFYKSLNKTLCRRGSLFVCVCVFVCWPAGWRWRRRFLAPPPGFSPSIARSCRSRAAGWDHDIIIIHTVHHVALCFLLTPKPQFYFLFHCSSTEIKCWVMFQVSAVNFQRDELTPVDVWKKTLI